MRRFLRAPFWQAVLLLIAAWLLFDLGIAYLPPLLGVSSAPVPGSVVLEYMLIAFAGILLYMSADEERWRRFQEPVRRTLVEPGRKGIRLGLLIAVPLLAGFLTWRRTHAEVSAPAALRSVHPAPPNQITFRGQTMRLAGLENPLRGSESVEEHIEAGAAIYAMNCVPCHGDRLDGDGHFAHAFTPPPADFRSSGAIDQLTESYVFWRITKGGPGLPVEGTPWNSAMPAWETVLTREEIWSVILYLYDQTGWTPRTWEEAGAGDDGE